MKISVILTSRNNVHNVITAVVSVIEKFSGRNDLEILVALDDDDLTREEVIEKLKRYSFVKVHVLPRVGYFKISKFLNFLGERTTGDLIWLLSDKTTIETRNWDVTLEQYEGKFIVCGHHTHWIDDDGSTREQVGMLFPIISRQWYNVLGKICDHPHMDSCIAWTMENVSKIDDEGSRLWRRVVFDMDTIWVEHDRRKAAKIDKLGVSDFYTNEYFQVRLEDAKKIYAYLLANPHVIP